MRKNVLIIVIDALSKWYIDQCKKDGNFFQYLQKESYCANQMYSTGPFTEAAVRGFWTADEALDGISYLSENAFNKRTIFELFAENGYYMYMGELIPYFNYDSIVHNEILREACEKRAFEHVWRARLKYYISLFNEKRFEKRDYWKLKFILDDYFEKYRKAPKVNLENEKYERNKDLYIGEILSESERSSFFQNQVNALYYNCSRRNIVNFYNQKKHIITTEELQFVDCAKRKNIEFLLQMNKKFKIEEFIEKELNGTTNRCINSNNNLLCHLRDENERLPKLREELNEFILWYDSQKDKINKPFFAYIHNYDFHYPENFMNFRYDDYNRYIGEVIEKTELIRRMECRRMSVSKQLSIFNIENCLKEFWTQLKTRDIFQDTYIILTADHGISNFMYPVDKKKERWNYTKMNFQVPFYLLGSNVGIKEDNYFRSTKTILPALIEMCQLKYNSNNQKRYKLTKQVEKSEKMISAFWINGVPDLDRQMVKLGIRNEKYSITCEAYITQFFASANILGIYNLETDPDETVNLKIDEVNDKDFKEIYCCLQERWFENVYRIISDKTSKYGYWKKYTFIVENADAFRRINKLIKRLSYSDFIKKIAFKDVIFWGAGEEFERFMNCFNIQNKIIGIWDNDEKKNGKYLFGHRISGPHPKTIKEDTVVIITSRYEMEIVNQLYKAGIEDFYLSSTINI